MSYKLALRILSPCLGFGVHEDEGGGGGGGEEQEGEEGGTGRGGGDRKGRGGQEGRRVIVDYGNHFTLSWH